MMTLIFILASSFPARGQTFLEWLFPEACEMELHVIPLSLDALQKLKASLEIKKQWGTITRDETHKLFLVEIEIGLRSREDHS